jgi:cysteine-rich repeat protein
MAHSAMLRSVQVGCGAISGWLSVLALTAGCGSRTGLWTFEDRVLGHGGAAGDTGAFGGAGVSRGGGDPSGLAGSGASGGGASGGGASGGGASGGGASGAGEGAASGAGGVPCTAGMPGCAVMACGDGIIEAPEECDDGNRLNGDSCSANCEWEPRAVAVGVSFSCALGYNGAVKCWGDNDSGELGLGDTRSRGAQPGQMGSNLPAIELGTGRTAQKVAAGYQGSCAILDNGSLKCWGENIFGELGLGDTDPRGTQSGQMGDNLPAVELGTGRTALALAGGPNRACAILDNGSLKCWGENGFGELGLGDTNSRGSAPGQMGDNLPAVDLGSNRTATAVAMGASVTCALLDNQSVKCWGSGFRGELGLGDTTDHGSQPGQMGDNLPTVDLGSNRTATAIAAGRASACARLDDGSIKCWGENGLGELGLGDTENRGDEPGEMGDALPTVDLGIGRSAQTISGGRESYCALLDNDTVKCWGVNELGALGTGDSINRGDAPGEMGDRLPAIDFGTGRAPQSLVTGGFSSCALLDDGTVKCWGDNFSGDLGLGDTENRGDEPGEMGDQLPAVNLTF